ncbi:hypothetical protein D7X33_00255 [Butyricicoccus sp. 1XD8-22]|nr:hypothetical protein D7X33_00255 [Butyricicoccus sp. 1XD8-22]
MYYFSDGWKQYQGKGVLLMAGKRPAASPGRTEAARIWLSYYNRVLYEKGMLTEQERSRMEMKINRWQIPFHML